MTGVSPRRPVLLPSGVAPRSVNGERTHRGRNLDAAPESDLAVERAGRKFSRLARETRSEELEAAHLILMDRAEGDVDGAGLAGGGGCRPHVFG